MAKPPTSKKKTSTPQRKTKATPKPSLPEGVSMTNDTEDDQEIMLGLGQIGAGKTFVAASASQFRTRPVGKEPKMTELEDMFWGEGDSKACAGFKHNNLKVRRYNFVSEMHRTGKSITYVIQAFMDRVAEMWHEDLIVVVDTLTGLDTMLFQHNMRKFANHPNSYEVYKQNLAAHMLLSQNLKELNCHMILLAHGRAVKDNDDDKNIVVRMAGGGQIVPDITGQSPKFYKRDSTLQWAVVQKRNPRTKKRERRLLFGLEAGDEGYEGKNRYEDLLPDSMTPPDLRRCLSIIKEGR